MKEKGSQFHPSRDRRPAEYTLPPNVPGAIDIKGHGRYTESELAGYAQSFGSDPTWEESKEFFAGPGGNLQGALFDADKWERAQVTKLGRKRFDTTSHAAESTLTTALSDSTIPSSHLQPRQLTSGREPSESTFMLKEEDISGYNWQGVGGYYSGPALNTKADTVAVASGGAVVHELGHRQHLGTSPAWSDDLNHPRQINPDPLKEGVADAYEDRYGGAKSNQVRQMSLDMEFGAGKFPSYQYTGYSTDPEAKGREWTASDRAVYAATRAHASETGEQARYVPRGRDVREQPGIADYGGGDPTVDATLHHLLSTSPHAAQALRQTGLKDVGAQAFRRHRDRQLVTQGQSVQDSLFHELRGVDSGKVHGYSTNIGALPTDDWDAQEAGLDQNQAQAEHLEAQHGEIVWPHHMSHNQFGEAPRTQAQVANSLGVSRVHSRTLGFTER